MNKRTKIILLILLSLLSLFPIKVAWGAPNLLVDYVETSSTPIRDPSIPPFRCKDRVGTEFFISYYEIEPLAIYIAEKVMHKPIYIYYFSGYEATRIK